jgi:hypothetical protein
LVVALILNAALYIAVVYPMSMKVDAAERTARDATDASMAARREFESAKNTVSGKAAASAELKKFYTEVLPPDLSAAQRITYLKITQLAKKANVTYEQGSNAVEQERGSTLGALTTTVMLSGQYRDIRRFIHELETAPEFLILQTVALSQGSATSTVLNVTIKVSIYYQAGGDGV